MRPLFDAWYIWIPGQGRVVVHSKLKWNQKSAEGPLSDFRFHVILGLAGC